MKLLLEVLLVLHKLHDFQHSEQTNCTGYLEHSWESQKHISTRILIRFFVTVSDAAESRVACERREYQIEGKNGKEFQEKPCLKVM